MGQNPETPSDDLLFDGYVDDLLRGQIQDPEEYLGRSGSASNELRRHLQRIHDSFAPPAPPANGRSPDPDLPFARLGEYRLIRRLGSGGMGVVYLAEQASLGRRVALKVTRPDHDGLGPASARFEREARAIARLQHPHIVTVHGVGFDQGVRYIAMELVDGRGLDEILSEASESGRPLRTPDLLLWILQITRALAYAHGEGIVHRDVKPSNIRITTDGRALLLDFGLARDLEDELPTLTSMPVGTPSYMAPEQVSSNGTEVDRRTDIHALGCTLYHGLTGRKPFPGSSMEEIFHRILVEEPVAPRKIVPSIPRDLELVVLHAMEKEIDRRYASAAELALDLEALLELRPVSVHPPGPVRRLRSWARSHRRLALLSALTLMLLLSALGTVIVLGLRSERERSRRALATLEEARDLVTEVREGFEGRRDLELRIGQLRGERYNRFFTAEEDELLHGTEQEIARRKLERDRATNRVLDLLRRAEELGTTPEETRAVRGRLYLARYLEATELEDSTGQLLYRELLREEDPRGILDKEVSGKGEIVVVSQPEGAEVHLFRWELLSEVVEGGEPRLVPVACPGPTPVPPGTFCLRVQRPHDSLGEGDLVVEIAGHPIRETVLVDAGREPIRSLDRLVEIDGHPVRDRIEALELSGSAPGGERSEHTFVFDRQGTRFTVRARELESLGITLASPLEIAKKGGVQAVVQRDGRLLEERLPSGLDLRVTSLPLPFGPRSLLGLTPVLHVPLEAGKYVVVVRKSGYEEVRVHYGISRRSGGNRIFALRPAGTSPPGFVHVETWNESDRFWIMEDEVTVRQYLEFLGSAEARDAMSRSRKPILFPRDSSTVDDGGHFQLRSDGSWTVPDWLSLDMPILGISHDDACAYTGWRTARAREQGHSHTFRLPTRAEWTLASGQAGDRRFVFGNDFRPKWVSSWFSRRTPNPEAVNSYPIDESIFGVHDLMGSVSEFLATPLDGTLERHVGGSWGTGNPDSFDIWSDLGLPADRPSNLSGFRLVLEIDDGETSREDE